MTMAFPRNYNDPLYASLAASMEQQFGLPSGILDAIRNHGEMTNAGRVSSAGAQTPYQFIPSTRQGMIKNYGTDPWSDPESSTKAAAQLLIENHARTGNWDDAIRMYHGGTNRANWGPQNRAYAARVGDFDNGGGMPQNSLYDGPDIPGSFDPHYVSNVTEPVPVPGDAGPSRSMSPNAPIAVHKKRGILGTIGHILGQVFMPDPHTLWAGALRDGLVNAKESQARYNSDETKATIANEMANAKLKNFLTKGEYQIAGNNVIHFPPDGGSPEVITPPTTPSEHERLIDKWRSMDDSDPAKKLIERMLLGGSSDEVLQNREAVARTRASATTGAANIRAKSQSKAPSVPQGWSVVR
jgi:hypothetical protein